MDRVSWHDTFLVIGTSFQAHKLNLSDVITGLETGVLHAGGDPPVLLQRRARNQMDVEEREARIPRGRP